MPSLRSSSRAGERLSSSRDRVGLPHARQVADRRHEVFADALDQPGAGLRRSCRSRRSPPAPSRPGSASTISTLRRHALEVAAEPGDACRPSRRRTTTASSSLAHLLPDLRAGGRLVRQRVGRIVELVDVVARRSRGRCARPGPGSTPGGPCATSRAGHAHLGAHRAQVEDLLLAHLVGNHEDQPVALAAPRPAPGRARCCPRWPRRASPPGPSRAALLGRFDHRAGRCGP